MKKVSYFLPQICETYSAISFLNVNIIEKYHNFKFLQAAKEAKVLEAAKINLEKQVEELTSILETERRMRVIYLFIV